MNASAGSMLVLQILIMGGAVLWWAYLVGFVLAGAALMRARRPVVRIWAKWSLVAQLAPVALALVLLPVFFAELMFDAPLRDGLATLLGGTALLAGPTMSIGLIGVWVLKPRVTNTTASVLVCGILLATLAACGEQAESLEPVPAERAAIDTPVSDAEASAPVVLTAADLRRVCQAGLAEIHGQTVADIQIDGLEGRVVNASWRAPVDGGRRRAQCRVDGDHVIWKPVDRIRPEDDRWMDQAGDPVTRFVLDGETVTINQTLPDGGAVADDQGRG